MKRLVWVTIFSCFLLIAKAQPGGTRISMGETPGINLNHSELKGPVKEIIELEYYRQKNEDVVDTSKVIIKTIIKFDQKGNETQELKYGRTGKLLSRCIYDYANPKSVIVQKYIQDTLMLGKYVFACDDNGRVMELTIISGRFNNAAFRTVYKYNNKGDNDTLISYAGNYVVSRNNFQYNEKNQKIDEKSYDFRGNLNNRASFSYDDKGNITENRNIDMGLMNIKSLTKRSKMDKYGNWQFMQIEDDMLSDNIRPKEIIKRVIQYY